MKAAFVEYREETNGEQEEPKWITSGKVDVSEKLLEFFRSSITKLKINPLIASDEAILAAVNCNRTTGVSMWAVSLEGIEQALHGDQQWQSEVEVILNLMRPLVARNIETRLYVVEQLLT